VKKSATPMIPSSAKLLTALSIADMKSGITVVSQGTKTTVADQIAVEQIKYMKCLCIICLWNSAETKLVVQDLLVSE
jgi:hypothetical protein